MRIAKRWTFDAAHMLPNHDGKCARLHGHTYVVEVMVEGALQTSGPAEGMVVDFYHLSAIWKNELEPMLDHRYLNDTIPGAWHPTTAENISRCIANYFTYELALLRPPVRLYAVRVWETPTGYAEFIA